MLFNEYTDILESGDVFFLDEENLYQLMMEEDQNVKTPPNGLNSNDSSASSKEKPDNNADNNQQQGNNGDPNKARQEGRSLLGWFKAQGQHMAKWGNEQRTKLSGRIQEYMEKIKQIPADYAGTEEIEMPSKGIDPTPRMDRSGGDNPGKIQQKLNEYKQKVQEWQQRQEKKSKVKTFVKGVSAVAGSRWLIKQLTKMSGELDINLKEGSFHIGVGQRAAQKGASGDGFGNSLAHVVKNVFLAILVLIGGLFKVIKEYLTALARIIGAIFKTLGQAGQTLVTGQMPSKKK